MLQMQGNFPVIVSIEEPEIKYYEQTFMLYYLFTFPEVFLATPFIFVAFLCLARVPGFFDIV